MSVFGIVYGPAKTGKTLATVRAFPDGLFIAPKGGLTCARWLNWEPKLVEADEKIGMAHITQIIKQAQDKYPAIIIDDFSIICDVELAKCKKSHSGWSAFDAFNQRVYELRDAARAASCHVFLTMHEQPPKEVKKEGSTKYIPGSPLIPGWQLPEKLPAMADLVVRVIYDDDALGWPYLYQAGPDPDYITGDRLAITPEKFPLNLREVLLLAGYDLPRPEELQFMDEHVGRISQELVKELNQKRPKIKAVLQPFVEGLSKEGIDNRHVRWIIADALDRAQLNKHNNNLIDNFINTL
tara:strand:- start:494 stop:1381 length:888 start_codon:yes stop_codon:yes gene_type:complete